MSGRIDARYRVLIDAVRDRIQTKISGPDGAIDVLTQVDSSIACLDFITVKSHPKKLPACRYLSEIYSRAKNTNMASILSAFEKLEPYLEWVQNPNYSDARLGVGYMENYAYCDFIGPRGLTGGNSFAAGFLLLGPNLFYPDHIHAASEVYCVIGGTADWRIDRGEWRSEPPGSFIFHLPWIVHSTRCKQEPLLALYFWIGDVTQAANLV